MIFVAGSGPSGKGHSFAHVVTKKKLGWDYEHIVVPRANWITPRMHDAIAWNYYSEAGRWNEYYAGFKPAKYKPSNGLQAVFVAIDKYDPDEIRLIGFDWIMGGAKPTQHDWRAERRCIESLVRICPS